MEESTLSPIENSSDYEYDFVFDDYNQHIVVATAYLVAAFLGIAGNSLVIFSVFASRKLRTVTNAFVVNLSIADLVTSLMIPWNAGILLGYNEYPIKEWGCVIVAGLLFTCVGTSLFTLASIALNRLMLITRPMKHYRILYSPFYTGLWIAATWVIPFCFNIVPPLADVGQLGTSQKYRVCAAKSKHPDKNTYDYIQALGCFPVPLLTLIVCYTLIHLHLRRHSKHLKQHRPPASSCSDGDTLVVSESNIGTLTISGTLPGSDGNFQSNFRSNGTFSASANANNNVGNSSFSQEETSKRNAASTRGNTSRGHRRRRASATEATMRKRENNITKNMFMVFLAFVICILPYGVTLFFDESAPFVPYASALILLNACVNPILYGVKHPYFNQVFRCLLTRRWQLVPEPSEAFKSLRTICCCSRRL